ncbi:MAG TPA: polysaccharide deacetylase family protein [Flavobacteriales bacterium]|nr:polysaccharide deacetylase family protein [Flavobacteriales bacterium]
MAFVERYAEIKAREGRSPRAMLRHVVLDGLSQKDRLIGRTERGLRLPRVQFLYIHHSFTDELDALRRLVEDLSHTHAFIPYSEGVTRVQEGRIDRPYICLSSDDGFRNNLDGARVLRELGVSACFFINPALIGLNDEMENARLCADRFHLPPVRFLDRKEVEELVSLGHEIGSHSWEHHRMSALPYEAMVEDIQRTRETLLRWLGRADHFAFPYGRFADLTASGYRAVFAAGHVSCATAERGCHANTRPIPADHLLIRRDHIILDWPLAHIRYFLGTNAMNGSADHNPYCAAP